MTRKRGHGIQVPCKRVFLAVILIVLCPRPMQAQQAARAGQIPLRFNHLSVEDGLSQNDVFTILQDRRGFLWFGTNFGLNRYDGYTFAAYKNTPFDTTSLSANWIQALHEDRAGMLWVGTSRGLNRMDPGTAVVTRYLNDLADPHSLSHNEIWAIHEDRAGMLWVGTSDGLNQFDREQGRFLAYRHDPADPHSLSSDLVYALHEDPAGTLWISTANGLNRHDPDRPGRFTRYLYNPAAPREFRNDIIHGIAAEPDRRENVIRRLCNDPGAPGILWVSTERGLLRFDPETGRHRRYLPDPDDPDANTVMAVEADPTAAGVFWLTTNGGGLYRFDTRTETFTAYRHTPNRPAGLSSNKLFPLYRDRTGLLWIGSFGEGVSSFYPTPSGFAHYRHAPGDPGSLSHNYVWAIREDTSGALWVGTNHGLNRLDRGTAEARFVRYFHDPTDPGSLSGNNVNALLVDRAGTLWVGLYPGGLNRLDSAQGRFISYRHAPGDSTTLSSDYIMSAILEDAEGRLWVGTAAGLNRFDAETGTFTRYLHDPNNSNSISRPAVYNIHERATEPGVLWLATTGGLNRFDTRTGQFIHFTEKNGLPSNRLLGILEDEANRLWLSTARGLARFDPETGDIRTYDVDQGLQSGEFNPNAFFKSDQGEMFFGGINGFNAFYPDRIAEHPVPPEVAISNFTLFNEPVPVGEDSPLQVPLDRAERIRLTAAHKVFTFEFVALHYLNAKKNQYAYQLEGFDEDWVMTGTRRSATYTNLDPGAYTFRVKASNSDGVWNEAGASIEVVIAPPWWQTRSAYGACALLLALGVFMAGRLQRRRLIRQEQEKARIREARIKAAAAEERAVALQEIDRMKSRFFANISHEFRTPLTLITGPLEDLLVDRQGSARADLQEQHRGMLRNAQRLLRLVDQLLDLARLEAGRMDLHEQPGDLAAFMRNLVRAFAPLAERRRIMLHFQSEKPTHPLRFDPDVLEKVFGNLLSNALKFTPEGGKVWVTVGERRIAEERVVEVVVKDTGPGIPREALPRIFDRFERVAGAAEGGTGIGLALAKELAERHGGCILVESEPGFGSVFIVRLPTQRPVPTLDETGEGNGGAPASGPAALEVAALTPDAAPLDTTAPAEEAAATILLVEDNAEVRAFLRKHLETTYRVLEATDGAVGLERAREVPPDLVLSDVMMPVMDGYALCRALRADARLCTIPVILLTAKAGEQETVRGLEAGADDYIAKPFSVPELKARVAALIRASRQARRQFSREIVVQPAGVTIPSADAVFLDRVRAVIEARLGDSTFTAGSLADAVGLSRRQLERRLSETAGETPAGLLRRMRLERARQLLAVRSGTVAEVAYAVGFKSPAHFSKAFRIAFGVSPSAFSENAS